MKDLSEFLPFEDEAEVKDLSEFLPLSGSTGEKSIIIPPPLRGRAGGGLTSLSLKYLPKSVKIFYNCKYFLQYNTSQKPQKHGKDIYYISFYQ